MRGESRASSIVDLGEKEEQEGSDRWGHEVSGPGRREARPQRCWRVRASGPGHARGNGPACVRVGRLWPACVWRAERGSRLADWQVGLCAGWRAGLASAVWAGVRQGRPSWLPGQLASWVKLLGTGGFGPGRTGPGFWTRFWFGLRPKVWSLGYGLDLVNGSGPGWG